MKWNALVILSPGFEETEAITVIDILRRASIPTTTASLTDNLAVMGSHAITIMADVLFNKHDTSIYNVLVLPGGLQGVENMLSLPAVLELVCRIVQQDGILAAVCAAPLVLDACGLLAGQTFTCHPTVTHRLSSMENRIDVPVVRSGRLVTGRSAGCALVWAIALVEHLIDNVPKPFYQGLCCP